MLARLLGFALFAAAASAQEFEVASIRRCAEQSFEKPAVEIAPGRFTANCVPVDFLIESAHYNSQSVNRVTLQNAPAWTKSEYYQVTAKAEDPNAVSAVISGPMLLHLLETRFQLKWHQVTEEIPIYALMLGKDDAKLRAHENVPARPAGGMRPEWTGTRTTLVGDSVGLDWLSMLGPMALGRPVVNRTGINGSYKFRLEFEPERPLSAAAPQAPAGPSIFDALENELGLKLVDAKGTAARIIIDGIERPSDN
jgi:uncharacterized protein (TIGR03435 family)